jgi:hypothetical protein
MLMAKGIVATVEDAALMLDRQRTVEEQGEIMEGETRGGETSRG